MANIDNINNKKRTNDQANSEMNELDGESSDEAHRANLAVLDSTFDEAFEVHTLVVKSPLSLFFRTFMAASGKSIAEEQRFLGVMERNCIDYLAKNPKLLEDVKSLNNETIKKQRVCINRHLNIDQIMLFNSKATEMRELLKLIIDKCKVIYAGCNIKAESKSPDYVRFLSENAMVNILEIISSFVVCDRIQRMLERSVCLVSVVQHINDVYTENAKRFESIKDDTIALRDLVYQLYDIINARDQYEDYKRENVLVEFVQSSVENDTFVSVSFMVSDYEIMANAKIPFHYDLPDFRIHSNDSFIKVMELAHTPPKQPKPT